MNSKYTLFILTIFFVTHHNVNAGICHSLLKKQLAYNSLEDQDEELEVPPLEDTQITLPRTSKSSFAKASADKKKTKAGLHQKLTQRQLTGRCPFKSMKADDFAQTPCFKEEIQRDIEKINECDASHPEIYWKWMKELPLEYQNAIMAEGSCFLTSLGVDSKKKLIDALNNNAPVWIVADKRFDKKVILDTLKQLPWDKKELIWGLHMPCQDLTDQELKEILVELSPDKLQTLMLCCNQLSDISLFLPYRHLKMLDISGNKINEIIQLAPLTSLTDLEIFIDPRSPFFHKGPFLHKDPFSQDAPFFRDGPFSEDQYDKVQQFFRARPCKKYITIDCIDFLAE